MIDPSVYFALMLSGNNLDNQNFNLYENAPIQVNFKDVSIAQNIENITPETEAKPELMIMPIGINLGDRNVNPSSSVKGLEDGEKAINFEQWLIPFDDVISALDYNVNTLDDGVLELKSFASVIRINQDQLLTDPDLGLVFTVEQIRTLLNVPVEFNLDEYAVIFTPSWLNNNLDQKSYLEESKPINLEGLPIINAPQFSLTAISQNAVVSGSFNSNINYQGELIAVGNLFNGSWFAQIDQNELDDFTTWQLKELQYLKQTSDSDWVLGNHNPFWGSNFFGVSNVQRFGFSASNSSNSLGDGFNVSQRLRSDRLQRDLIGQAEPGTLAQLVTNSGNLIVAEVLVDSSGLYRFENVITADRSSSGSGNGNYRIFLYPNGDLTATPEIIKIDYSNSPAQLSLGTCALVLSAGVTQLYGNNQFFPQFGDFTGGILYRLGLTNTLTLGMGLAYHDGLKVIGDFVWQPDALPLKMTGLTFLDLEKSELKYKGDLAFNPFTDFSLNFNSDESSQRINSSLKILPGVNLTSSWNSQDQAIASGLTVGGSLFDLRYSSSISLDSKNLRWDIRSSWQNLELTYRNNDSKTNTTLTYKFSDDPKSSSSGNTLRLNYDTNEKEGNFTSITWQYRSPNNNDDNLAGLSFELGYGFNDQSSGFFASASTSFLSGLNLTASYQGISSNSNDSSFTLLFSTDVFVQPSLSFGSSRSENLRTEGGLFLQSFYDQNNNNTLDAGEKIYEESNLLFLINNKAVNTFGNTNLTSSNKGLFLRLAPGYYRLDLDTGGAPLGWQTSQLSSVVEVNPGGFTSILVPLSPSYSAAGQVFDQQGNPLGGVKVELIPVNEGGKRALSVTNRMGIYYLEGLQLGQFNLLVDGQSPQPNLIEIKPDQNSEDVIELNLIIDN